MELELNTYFFYQQTTFNQSYFFKPTTSGAYRFEFTISEKLLE